MNIKKYFDISVIGGGKRKPEVDVAKGIGIVLVIMGHCGGCTIQQVILTSFHMPLFFFLSGLFLLKKTEPDIDFMKKKAKTLLFPCLIFGLILSTYSTGLDLLRNDNTIPYGLRYIGLFINMRQNPFPGSLWFFPCLFMVEMMLFYLHKFSKGKTIIMSIGVVIFTCLGLLVHHFYGKGLPWSLDIALYCTSFTMVGYVVKDAILRKYSVVTYIIALIVFIISVYVNYKYMGESIDLYCCRLGLYPLFFISAFTGIYLSIGLAKILQHIKILNFFGQNSMIIYPLQYLFILPIGKPLELVVENGLVRNIIHTIIILLILTPIINIINRQYKWMTGKF